MHHLAVLARTSEAHGALASHNTRLCHLAIRTVVATTVADVAQVLDRAIPGCAGAGVMRVAGANCEARSAGVAGRLRIAKRLIGTLVHRCKTKRQKMDRWRVAQNCERAQATSTAKKTYRNRVKTGCRYR
jgi:hypothetical protein